METAAFRGRLMAAIAGGLAAGCQTPPAPQGATTVTVAPPTPDPNPALAPTPTPSPTPAPTPQAVGVCPEGAKQEPYCLDPRTNPHFGAGAQFMPKFDSHGCVDREEALDSCNGVVRVFSGPSVQGGKCCYSICQGPIPPCGRPLVVAGASRVAAVIGDGADTPWLRDALAEHASIASFARFSLELMAVGAPMAFVEDAHRAALDEIEHARLCFSLASRGGPGPFPLDGLSIRSSLAEVAAAAASEACCAETHAAVVAMRTREECTDPVVRRALDRIAPDEARHAELGWRFVAWALAHGGDDVRDAVAHAFEQALAELGPCEARDEIIEPCAERLLQQRPARATQHTTQDRGSSRSDRPSGRRPRPD